MFLRGQKRPQDLFLRLREQSPFMSGLCIALVLLVPHLHRQDGGHLELRVRIFHFFLCHQSDQRVLFKFLFFYWTGP